MTVGEMRATTWGRPYREHREYNTEPMAVASPRPTGVHFSWRLAVLISFVSLGDFPLKGEIRLGRRRGRARRGRGPVRCVKDAAPYRFASSDARRTAGEHQGRRA